MMHEDIITARIYKESSEAFGRAAHSFQQSVGRLEEATKVCKSQFIRITDNVVVNVDAIEQIMRHVGNGCLIVIFRSSNSDQFYKMTEEDEMKYGDALFNAIGITDFEVKGCNQ